MRNKLPLIFFWALSSRAFAVTENMDAGSWSPYVVGFCIGVLSWLTFSLSGKPIGASSSYASLSGMIGNLFSKSHTLSLRYFRENPPKVDWEFVFVAAAIVGSFLAAYTGGEFQARWVPELWQRTHGLDSSLSYAALAFVGGVLMAFGARLAGGCTSGHGISGTLQLSVSSWVTVACFFVSGALIIRLIY